MFATPAVRLGLAKLSEPLDQNRHRRKQLDVQVPNLVSLRFLTIIYIYIKLDIFQDGIAQSVGLL